MSVTLEDLLLKLDDNKGEIQKEIRENQKELSGRLGGVESELAGLSATVKGQGREIGDVKTQVRDHINGTTRPIMVTPPAPAPTEAKPNSWPPARVNREVLAIIKYWGTVAAIAGGIVTSILNVLGVI